MKLPHAPSAPPARACSEELRALAHRLGEGPVPLGEILGATQGRGFNLLLLLIALPFLTPIPLPGFSVPFGLVAAAIGARLALGQKPWLPQPLLRRTLPPRFLSHVLMGTSRVVRTLELFLQPRWAVFHDYLVFRRLAGALIAVSGFFLTLPLPLPFSNSLPAATILLLAAGALERDGLAFLAGCVLFLVTSAYFVGLALGGAQTIQRVHQLLTGT